MKSLRTITSLLVILAFLAAPVASAGAMGMHGMHPDHCAQSVHCSACNSLPTETSATGQVLPPARDALAPLLAMTSRLSISLLERPPR